MMGAQHLAQLSAFMLALLCYSRPQAERAVRRLAAHSLACPFGDLLKASVLPAADHSTLVLGDVGYSYLPLQLGRVRASIWVVGSIGPNVQNASC